jgi:hypothetical protein
MSTPAKYLTAPTFPASAMSTPAEYLNTPAEARARSIQNCNEQICFWSDSKNCRSTEFAKDQIRFYCERLCKALDQDSYDQQAGA